MALQNKLGSIDGLFRYPVKSLRGEALQTAEVRVSGITGDRLWAFRDVERNEITSAKRSPLLLHIAASLDNDDGAPPQARLALPAGEITRTDAPECAAVVSKYSGRQLTLCSLRPASDAAHFARAPVAPEKFEAYLRESLGLLADEPLPDFSKLPGEVMMNATVPGTYFDAATIHIILASELRKFQRSLPHAGVDAMRFRPNLVLNDLENPLSSDDLVGARIKVGGAVLVAGALTPRCAMTTHAQDKLPKAPEIMRSLVRDWSHNFGLYASVAQGGQIRMGDTAERLPGL